MTKAPSPSVLLKETTRRELPFLKLIGGIIVAYFVLLWAGPWLEAKTFPVAGEFSISRVDGADGPSRKPLVLQLESSRFRPACRFVYLMWYGRMEDGTYQLLGDGRRRNSFQDSNDKPRPQGYYGQPSNPKADISNTRPVMRLWTSAPQFYAVLTYSCPLEPWYSRVSTPLFDNWSLPDENTSDDF